MNVLVTGATGLLAGDLVPLLANSGDSVRAFLHAELDITDAGMVNRRIAGSDCDIVINCAAYTSVDRAETEREVAFAVNRDGPANLAEACARRDIPLIHFSTDYVFDGVQDHPYLEDDLPLPLNVYGQSKWEGEKEVRNRCRRHIIIRTSWLYGLHRENFVTRMIAFARERETVEVVHDQIGCPTWSMDLAGAVAAITHRLYDSKGDAHWGTYHYCGRGFVSRYQAASAIVTEAGGYEPLRIQSLIPVSSAEFDAPAKRPSWSVLDTNKIESMFGIRPRYWNDSLSEFLALYYDRRSGQRQ